MNKATRDTRIDVLRFLAIILILLGHSSPPTLLGNLRTFDVSLMVFVMGMSYSYSREKGVDKYGSYVIKRLSRLLIPTWNFLVIFYLFFFVSTFITRITYPFSVETMISSFQLESGFGFVWIFRVFIVISLFFPISYIILSKVKYLSIQLTLLTFLLLFQQSVIRFQQFFPESISPHYHNFIVIPFGYLIVAAFGMLAVKLRREQLFWVFELYVVIFLISAFYQNFEWVNKFKYPPNVYYLSYGLLCSFLLLFLLTSKFTAIFRQNDIVKWFSTHSLDLYYWHLIIEFILRIFFRNWLPSWPLKFTLLLIGSFILTVLNSKLAPRLLSTNYLLLLLRKLGVFTKKADLVRK
ncbi:acyltransferase family protein [Enterococcus sp. LJL51]|uniref:acyltransferase family protein n=1 Tax=Enterococcus sp. LJL51 TaxID=3416656 RepID=UPI003CEF9FE4